MQHYMKYSSLVGIFSKKKIGLELQFEMLVNIGIHNGKKKDGIFSVHDFHYKHID